MNKIQSATVVDMAPGEIRTLTAWFGPLIGYTNSDGDWVANDSLSGTPAVAKKSGTTSITLGTPAVNSQAITVGTETRAAATAVQFLVTLPSDCATGDYIITCTATTAGGDTLKMDCLMRVWG